jgi:hypothetical protein
VDKDPLVLTHARALLASSPEGRTAYIHADLRDPRSILDSPAVHDILDLSQPTALMLVAVLHFIPDDDHPAEIIATLLDALPSGSYLTASHAVFDHDVAGYSGARDSVRASGVTSAIRTADEFAELAFPGLELVSPGVVPVSEWRPASADPRPTPAEAGVYGGVGRKP